MKRIILTIILFAGLLASAHAQTGLDITAEEKEQIIVRIKDKLEDFQYFLGTMADKNNSQQVRQSAYKANTLLFIGNCELYEVIDQTTGKVERKRAVEMETSSVNSNYIKRQPMKQYFINIMNNRAYSNIKIEQSDIIRVDNLRKVGEGKYEAVAHICQYFAGYNDNGQIRYGDITEKAVKILIDYYEIPNSFGGEIIYDIKLGNMKVLSTERLQIR